MALRGNLELPELERDDPRFLRALNDRLRRIQAELGQGVSTTIFSGSGGGSGDLILTVSGMLGVQAQAAPLVKLAVDRPLASLVALVKKPPEGGDIVAALVAAGETLGTVTIPALFSSAENAAVAGVTVPADALIALDITSVGLTIPGRDLTVIARFA